MPEAMHRLVRTSPVSRSNRYSPKPTKRAARANTSGRSERSRVSFAGQKLACGGQPVRSKASSGAAPAAPTSLQVSTGVSGRPSSPSATRLCQKHEIATTSASPARRIAARQVSASSSAPTSPAPSA